MFCTKCGTQMLENAKFCPKCGAQQMSGDAAPNQAAPNGWQVQAQTVPGGRPMQSQAQPLQESMMVSQKKKSKKVPIIFGIIAAIAAVIIIIAIAFCGGDETDYVATVKAYTPYAESQDLPYTCGEVFDKYISDAKWSVRKADDTSSYVDISGTAKGTDKELAFTIKVDVDEEKERAKFDVVSMKADNEEPKEDIFFALFVAYNDKDEDLHNLDVLLNELELALHQNSGLMTTFADDDIGISFQYPASWEARESAYGSEIVEIISSRNSANHRAVFTVSQLDYDPFGVFAEDEAAIKDAVNGSFSTFLEYGECMIGDVPAKFLSYQTEGLSGDDVAMTFWYMIGSGIYQVSCSYTASTEATYKPIFQMIMESYSIQYIQEEPPTEWSSSEGYYTDYLAWCGEYEGDWPDTVVIFELYSDGSQNPECGHVTTVFYGGEATMTEDLYYIGGNEFLWVTSEYGNPDVSHTYSVFAVEVDGRYQLKLYEEGANVVTLTQYRQYVS